MPHNRLWMAALACMWLLPAIAEETAAVTREGIAALIEQLGAEDYFERERAQRALAEIGIEAFDALEEAENHQDLEVADRARYLARRIDIEWVRDGDSTAVKRIMADYGSSSDENRLRKIAELAELPHADGTAALCRVSRFDSSRVRSKFAAVAIFEQKFAADDAEARREAISSNMANSVRPTAEWLRSHVAAQDNAAEALAKMTALAEAEERLLRENPSSTRLELAMALWRQVVAAARRAEREDDSKRAMLRMVHLEPGGEDGLMRLLDYLSEQKAWDIVEVTAKTFAEDFESSPILLYSLAKSHRLRGDEDRAREMAEKALAMGPNAEDYISHLILGMNLQANGMLDWAEAEYRKTLELAPSGERNRFICQYRLGEMLHDQFKEALAAEVLAEGAATIKRMRIELDDVIISDVMTAGEFLGRWRFFQSCAAAGEEDRDAELSALKEAVAVSANDADVLIALHRSPKLSDEDRRMAADKIAAANTYFRRQIQEAPDDPTPYNQLAWLLSNTDGDAREAVRLSEKSLELSPGTASYLDTLGRCHYAAGDLEKAIVAQEEAVAKEPFSGLIRRQLEQFRAELEAK